jgi:hypothetical protein
MSLLNLGSGGAVNTAECNPKEARNAYRFPVPWRRAGTRRSPKAWKSFVGLFAVGIACAQPNTSAPTPPTTALAPKGLYLSPAQIAPLFLPHYLALGDRLSKPGNERITLQGIMTTAGGSSPVQIVLELGGKLNITFGGPSAQKLVFDGTSAPVLGGLANGNDLLESFVDDLAENLVLGGRGVSPRLLGQRVADPSGGLCDYYDVGTYGGAVKTSKPYFKRYCFDSNTSLLKSVSYYTNSQLTVTEFGGWTTTNKQAVVGTVTRLVAGSQVFQFRAASSLVSPSVPDNTFKP